MVHVMIESGEDAVFVKVPKGQKVMLTCGDDSIFVRAGLTKEEVEEELVAFVKKLQRKIQSLIQNKPIVKIKNML